MKASRVFTWIAASSLIVASVSCRNRPGNGTGELTDQQKAAVESVVEQLEATARALTSVIESFEAIDAEGELQVGVCPVVTAELLARVLTVVVSFPEGCSNEYYGDDVEMGGGVTLVVDLNALSITVTFDNFTSDGQTVAGSLNVTLTREGLQRTLSGTIAITTTGVGSVEGNLEIEYDAAMGRVTIHEADLTLTDSENVSVSADVTGIVIEPIDNESFIPEAGSVRFELPGEGPTDETVTVEIEFTAQSPIDGTVSVSIDGHAPVTYSLAEFTD